MVKVLLAEDNETYRQVLKDFLFSRIASVDVAESAEAIDVMQKVSSFCPDIIFMDVRLPGESGLVLTKRIKSLYPHIAVVILTNYDFPEYRETAHQFGASHFLVKGSTTPKDLTELVESICCDIRRVKTANTD
jgi:DNA-binding NarL/FixJ family response regulator